MKIKHSVLKKLTWLIQRLNSAKNKPVKQDKKLNIHKLKYIALLSDVNKWEPDVIVPSLQSVGRESFEEEGKCLPYVTAFV
jgi:hypothetical protein